MSLVSARAVGLGPAFRKSVFSVPVLARGSRVATRSTQAVAKRYVQIQSMPPSASTGILNAQRLKRPSSPHFTIYQPQINWLASVANRMTGVALAGLLYAFGLAYLFVPSIFDSAHIVDLVSSVPDTLKYAGKTILAAPFAFHTFCGLRHLYWDMLKGLTVKSMIRSGYAALGATAITTVYLAFYM
ncbi:hypothetical protein FISHEDRAFT_63995 [Fistulina hepatica ATCC 64428]|uniref:Succinate dehydrogenase cytochrome b560 subunit n=1 Tax=Fistulina hepatica ATCC 64428 TaxID=1128425 RepID=A0A0D7AL72_9AGAR|nr:hypothetical protein FISHEDRAFT_63995 [Fistulina hepatica ATCC 64428]